MVGGADLLRYSIVQRGLRGKIQTLALYAEWGKKIFIRQTECQKERRRRRGRVGGERQRGEG